MNINIIIISFIVLVGLFFSRKDNPRNRGIFIILCSIILILVASLRSPDWFTQQYGLDTLSYKFDFEDTSKKGWDVIMKTIYLYYHGYGENYDVGYIIMNKIISFVTNSFFVFSFIANLIFFVPLGIILHRYSKCIIDIIFAYIFYIALVQIFLLAGARQIFAIGFDLMALLSLVDKNKIRTIIFFLIGVSIHLSSFLFIIPLMMIWFDARPRTLKKIHVICFILFPIVLAYPNLIIHFLGEASGSERYANYGTGEIAGGASTFIFLVEMLSLFCLFAIRRLDLLEKDYMRTFYVMLPYITFFAPLVRGDGTMIRISLYFHLFLMLLVPYAIDCAFKGSSRNLLKYIAIVGLAYMTLKGSTDYYFYWQI